MDLPDSAAREKLFALAESSPLDLRIAPDSRGVGITLSESGLNYYHSFVTGPLARRSRQSDQALLRACNNKQRNILSLLDLTAGWGTDSLTLARHGMRTHALEQNSLLAAILEYSLECLRATGEEDEAGQRMTVECVNSAEFLQTPAAEVYDCIYLDPMFPPHRSSARPGKELQILQALTGNSDIERCLELALEKARKRVVVKRPAKAPGLHEAKPDIVYREKSVRFDIYLTA
ncbi:MAG: class I SAM-dependent methyltransferase [Gammaproteobacteria bacterium]|jgi:16S rRNA (guanine1516-N2)-methyltransferase